MNKRNDPCWCSSGRKWKKCHHPLLPPTDFASQREEYFKKYKIILKTPEEIEGIRAASQLAANILRKVCARAGKGVTTEELNTYAMALHQEAGATPAPLGYGRPPFPKGICTSVNEVICHGIPNSISLIEGDILNIDVTSILNGYYGDCSAMVSIGDISIEKTQLIATCYECLMRAIEALKPGLLIREIGQIIEDHASAQGFSTVHQFVAHGVGRSFHEEPQIPHNRNAISTPLAPGMTFTIEPMINAGVSEAIIDSQDQWTARTADGKPSAQWEHTVLITEGGCEILTLS